LSAALGFDFLSSKVEQAQPIATIFNENPDDALRNVFFELNMLYFIISCDQI